MRDLKKMPVLTQQGPECGTTSLAMILRFLTQDSDITPQDIDKEIRRLPGMFSAPLDIMSYALKKGLRAQEYNRSSLQQVEEFVTHGIPVMPLLNLTPDKALDFDQWHWVIVVGVERADADKRLIINNPWGQQEDWDTEKFSKEWACLRLLGLIFGYSNYLIAVGTQSDKLPERRAKGVDPANAVTKGLADVLNGFAAVCSDRSFRGLSQMLGGFAEYSAVLCGSSRTILLGKSGLNHTSPSRDNCFLGLFRSEWCV